MSSKKKSLFQTILLIVFGAAIAIAMFLFSMTKSGGDDENPYLGEVTVWGTLPKSDISGVLMDVYPGKNSVDIKYVQKRRESFNDELVEALASGTGPDIVMLPQDLIVRHSNKIFKIPYESMPLRTFKDTFIEEGELYLESDGILGVPLVVDPMVMYWNRDIFSSVGVSVPPKYWDEFYELTKKITIKTGQSSIKRSTVAFGEFQNIKNAKEIISSLIMQAGDPIVVREQGTLDTAKVVLGEGGGTGSDGSPPAVSALNFYLEFSNPRKITYSWNRSLPSSFDMFTAGDLAMYFGFASEYQILKKKNPNLNFDVANMPQTRDTGKNVTFGRMLGLSVMKQTQNPKAAFRAIIMLTDVDFVKPLAERLQLVPARRDLLAQTPPGEFMPLFYRAAIMGKAWLDPSPSETTLIFKNMIEDVLSGRTSIPGSILRARESITGLLKSKLESMN